MTPNEMIPLVCIDVLLVLPVFLLARSLKGLAIEKFANAAISRRFKEVIKAQDWLGDYEMIKREKKKEFRHLPLVNTIGIYFSEKT